MLQPGQSADIVDSAPLAAAEADVDAVEVFVVVVVVVEGEAADPGVAGRTADVPRTVTTVDAAVVTGFAVVEAVAVVLWSDPLLAAACSSVVGLLAVVMIADPYLFA